MTIVIYISINILGVLLISISNRFDSIWWIGLSMSILSIIFNCIDSCQRNKKIKNLESISKATDQSFKIKRDENNDIIEATINGKEY